MRGQVVLQVLAHAGQVRDDRDVQSGQLVRVPDAGQLQQLRRVDRATGEDHLTRRDEPFGRTTAQAGRALRQVAHADRARPLEQTPVTSALHRTSRLRRLRTGCTNALAADIRRPLWMVRSYGAKPSLTGPFMSGVARMARRVRRVEERPEQGL